MNWRSLRIFLDITTDSSAHGFKFSQPFSGQVARLPGLDRQHLCGRSGLCREAANLAHEAFGASGAHLRELLRGNHRYVFTLIHKFQTPEMLSDRPDVIVLTDEAHRSQYDTLALNMRAALPKALFLAFTGGRHIFDRYGGQLRSPDRPPSRQGLHPAGGE